jgi:hypothetical protein
MNRKRSNASFNFHPQQGFWNNSLYMGYSLVQVVNSLILIGPLKDR